MSYNLYNEVNWADYGTIERDAWTSPDLLEGFSIAEEWVGVLNTLAAHYVLPGPGVIPWGWPRYRDIPLRAVPSTRTGGPVAGAWVLPVLTSVRGIPLLNSRPRQVIHDSDPAPYFSFDGPLPRVDDIVATTWTTARAWIPLPQDLPWASGPEAVSVALSERSRPGGSRPVETASVDVTAERIASATNAEVPDGTDWQAKFWQLWDDVRQLAIDRGYGSAVEEVASELEIPKEKWDPKVKYRVTIDVWGNASEFSSTMRHPNRHQVLSVLRARLAEPAEEYSVYSFEKRED